MPFDIVLTFLWNYLDECRCEGTRCGRRGRWIRPRRLAPWLAVAWRPCGDAAAVLRQRVARWRGSRGARKKKRVEGARVRLAAPSPYSYNDDWGSRRRFVG